MDNAKLTVSKNKKGKIIGEVIFDNGKKMHLTGFKLDENLNNKQCQVKRNETGQIIQVIIDGKELPRQEAKQLNNKHKRENNIKNNRKTSLKTSSVKGSFHREQAKAPYNFIPLNKKIVASEYLLPENLPTFNSYHANNSCDTKKLSGYIKYVLETITPIYIRDTNNNAQKENNDNPDFFSPGKKIKIPGSSIRGLIRTLVEIVSWSKLKYIDNTLLFYRTLADKCESVRKEYQKNISYGDKSQSPNSTIYAGYLKKDGFNYFIIPAKKLHGKQFQKIKKDESDKDIQFSYRKESDGSYIVIPGAMSKSKWKINEPDFDAEFVIIDDEDIQAYRNDFNRYSDKKENGTEDGDLLKKLDLNPKELVPCFYVYWKDETGKDRISFGHTRYFRLAYKKTICDHLPDIHKDENILDIADAIFGKESSFATRVFFEDAEILPEQNNVLLNKAFPKILSSPKPTSFQHYLEQSTDNKKYMNHWNSDAEIRGHKLYWHRNNIKWEEESKKLTKLHTEIIPIRSGVKFKGSIRFENLSKIELGALLFVLDLPEYHYHKLGMSKPLGLGSVKITPELYLIDRIKRYERLFTDDFTNFALAEEKHEMKPYIKEFEKYILDNIDEDERGNANTLWETERLKQLKVMLDWRNTELPNWVERTRYFEIEHPENDNEFRKRLVLRKPTDFIKQ